MRQPICLKNGEHGFKSPYLKALRRSIQSLGPPCMTSDSWTSGRCAARIKAETSRDGVIGPPRVSLPPLGDTIMRGVAISPLGCRTPLDPIRHHARSISRRINPFRRSHIFAVVAGMMVVSGDVAINGRASGSSWGPPRLSPVDETARARFAIGGLGAEDPISRLG